MFQTKCKTNLLLLTDGFLCQLLPNLFSMILCVFVILEVKVKVKSTMVHKRA